MTTSAEQAVRVLDAIERIGEQPRPTRRPAREIYLDLFNAGVITQDEARKELLGKGPIL